MSRLRRPAMVAFAVVLFAVALVAGGVAPSSGVGYPAASPSHEDIQVTELLDEDGEPLVLARRINRRGQVVAVDDRFSVTEFLYGHTLWHRGAATRLELDASSVPPDPPPGLLPEVRDISDRGHLIGSIWTVLPFVWKNDRYFDTSELFTASEQIDESNPAVLTAVNDRGKAAGWRASLSEQDNGEAPEGRLQRQTVVWHDGELLTAPIDQGVEAWPAGINNRSQVLVNLPTESNSGFGGPTVAGLWQVGAGITELGGLDDTGTSLGVALNERGQVAGDSKTADGATHAFLWHRGQMTDLGTLGGQQSVVGSNDFGWASIVFGTAISLFTGEPVPDDRLALNEWGHVVGTSETASGEPHAFLWQDGEMTDLGTLGGATSSARAVNNHGQVVGISETADGQTHAFLWQDGEMTDLGAAADAEESSQAMDINDRGQIVGQVDGRPFAAEGRAMMWTVPPR